MTLVKLWNQHGRCYMGSNDSSCVTSDQRLKKDIVNNTTGLEIINQVRVRNFKYKQYSDGSLYLQMTLLILVNFLMLRWR